MVTRETLLREGLAEIGLSGEGVPRLMRYHDLLLEQAVPRGFLGPREGPRLIERHILESAALAAFLPRKGRIADVGSGAGLPGVVLACLTDIQLVLLEAEHRRATFLEGIVRELGLRAEVLAARAEDAGRHPALRDSLDAAVARALAPPPVALELLVPLVRPGGRVALAVGPAAAEGTADLEWTAEQLGAGGPDLRRLQVPGLEEERWAMIFVKTSPTPERYPRRAGLPAKRPLRRPARESQA